MHKYISQNRAWHISSARTLNRCIPTLAILVLFCSPATAVSTPEGVSRTFLVTKTTDTADGACDADCSLREAVIAANLTSEADTIELPEGTYTLSLSAVGVGLDEESGDLDVLNPLTIVGTGLGATSIDGDHRFRLLRLHSGSLRLEGLTLINGRSTYIFPLENLSGPTRGVGVPADFNGGGIRTEPMTHLELDSCTVANNRTNRFNSFGEIPGGGIYVGEGATMSAINTTFNRNLMVFLPPTPLGYFPNSIYLASMATADLRSCTLVDDWSIDAPLAAATISGEAGASLTLTDSLIRSNCRGDEMVRISQGGNVEVIGDTCGLTDATDIVGIADGEIFLGSLADNGGPTQTRALLPGSIALDRGGANCSATDQRGLSRPEDGDGDGTASCDPGAFELRTTPLAALFFDGFETGDFTRWTSLEP